MTAPMTPEQLAEIKARDVHDNDESVYERWRTEDALRVGAQAMIDRAALITEVDYLHAVMRDAPHPNGVICGSCLSGLLNPKDSCDA